MAFEVHGETLVCYSEVEKLDPINLSVSKFDSVEETQKKSLVVKEICEYNSNQLQANSCGRRTITDLPPALVSEILHYLDAKELGIVSCVSILLNRVASDHQGWKSFYCERWGSPPLGQIAENLGSTVEEHHKSWKDLFVKREHRSKSFMGRYSVDVLYGHTEAVRSVFLLSSAKLIITAGYDSVIRIWDMEDGLSIASSKPLGCTIRAVAADVELLVVGGSDGFLHCWRAIEGLSYLFDLTASQNQNSEFRLWEHQGPVTCIALDPSTIYSGSWDMTIRIWDRSQGECLKVLRHKDWVWSLAPRGATVASTAGEDVYMWDVESGNLLTAIQNAHVGNSYSMSRSRMGDLLFTGGEDGKIHMFEVTNHCPTEYKISFVATWFPHTGAVQALAFEFPWLVSASVDGKMSLIDVRKLLKSRRRSLSKDHNGREFFLASPSMEAPQRMLHGFGSNLFAVDIGSDRIICGGEEGVVRIWNFSQALEKEMRVQAARGIRLENRMRRRKVQVEMNTKGKRPDQCSIAAKNQMNGDKNVWHGRGAVSGKLKT